MYHYWPLHCVPSTKGFELISGLPHPKDYDYFIWKGIEPDMQHLSKVIEVIMERAIYIGDLYNESLYFFIRPEHYDTQAIAKKWKPENANIILEIADMFASLIDFTSESLEERTKQWLMEKGIGIGAIMPVIRILLTGSMAGPAVFEIAALLGKEESINRLKTGLPEIEKQLNGKN